MTWIEVTQSAQQPQEFTRVEKEDERFPTSTVGCPCGESIQFKRLEQSEVGKFYEWSVKHTAHLTPKTVLRKILIAVDKLAGIEAGAQTGDGATLYVLGIPAPFTVVETRIELIVALTKAGQLREACGSEHFMVAVARDFETPKPIMAENDTPQPAGTVDPKRGYGA